VTLETAPILGLDDYDDDDERKLNLVLALPSPGGKQGHVKRSAISLTSPRQIP
jgi:hypothetical protein